MIKPKKLKYGDIIATISPSFGCAGDKNTLWQYKLGVQRLEEMGLTVVSAPNSLKGSEYLQNNPQARAEDLMWAFESKDVKAIIANIGGNDSIRLIPYLSPHSITSNPKILCGYSDVLSLHLYCYQLGLSTFYGDNLLTTIAESPIWHPYSQYWFHKVFFDETPIGEITPSENWSYDNNNYTTPKYIKKYIKNEGYIKIQGFGTACGRLFGGHGMIMEYKENCGITIKKEYFKNKIMFFEEIPEICDIKYIGAFFDWLGKNEYLQVLNGVIIGKMRTNDSFEPFASEIRRIVSEKYDMKKLPIMYGLNFGHTSPICILPYDAAAKLDIDNLKFSILENGVS